MSREKNYEALCEFLFLTCMAQVTKRTLIKNCGSEALFNRGLFDMNCPAYIKINANTEGRTNISFNNGITSSNAAKILTNPPCTMTLQN